MSFPGFSLSAPARYGLAVAVMLAALLLRWALIPVIGTGTIYITLFPAMMIVAVTFGMGPGLFGNALGIVLVEYFFVEQAGQIPLTLSLAARSAIMLLTTFYVGRVGDRLRVAWAQAQAEAAAARATEQVLRQQVELIDPARAQVITQEMQRVVRERPGKVAPASEPPGEALRRVPAVAGALVAGVGLLALAGWVFGLEPLKSVLPGLATMKANTALCYLLAGVGLALCERRAVRLVCAGLAFAVAGLTLAEYITRGDFGVDQLLFRDTADAHTIFPGRMAEATALGLLLGSASLLLLKTRGEATLWAQQALAVVTALIGATAFMGYAYDMQQLYRFTGFSSMALHTAASLAVLAVGLIFARSDGLSAVLTTPGPGAQLTRRLLPGAILLPAIVGWLEVRGSEAGRFDPNIGTSLLAISMMLAFAAMVWWSARALNRTDATRRETEAQMRNLAEVMDHAYEPLIVRELGGVIRAWNRGAEALYGWPAAEALGQRKQSLLRTDAHSLEVLDRQLESTGRWEGELNHTTRDGRRVTVESRQTASRIGDGKVFILESNRDITERRRSEEALRASEARLLHAQQIANVGSWEWDIETGAVWWSEQTYRQMGQDPARFTPSHEAFGQLVHAEDRATVSAHIERALAGTSAYDLELRIVRPDGAIRVLHSRGEVVTGPDGQPCRMAGVSLDITERKQAEEALRANETLLRSATDNASVGLVVLNRERRYTFANPAYARILGLPYSAADLIGKGPAEVLASVYETQISPHLDRAFAGERVMYELTRPGVADSETSHYMVVYDPQRDESGVIAVIVTIFDITERKRAEEALRISEKRLAGVVGAAMDAIITLDEQQRVLLFNAAAERIFCCPAADVIGKPLDRFLPERFREIHRSHIRTFGTTGATARSMSSPATLYGRRATGEEFPLEATISQATIGGQKLYTVILRDITQRKQAEELARLYAQSRELDRLKTEFFANVSHELRTPLALILGPIQKRLRAAGLPEEEQQDLEVVERNARLLLRHVNDLLDLSKLDAGKMNVAYSRVDLARLARLVASYFEILATERALSFAVDAPDSLSAHIDAPKVERVLLNLLSNAFKFTPAGGSVRLALRANDGRAIVEVEDSGPGIAPHLRETIFERFRQLEGGATREFGGTGLGLSIAKEFVSLHGGTIAVGDRPVGRGSLFRVELPLAAPAGVDVRNAEGQPDAAAAVQAVEELRIRSAARQRDGAAASGKPLILVVEDNPDMNDFMSQTLSGNYRVASAFDGEEGLAKALELRPDLILCDVMMPRMSGDQLLRALRTHRQLDEVPIVILTAKADDALRVALLREGAQDYLHKPVGSEELLAKVGRFIADRRRAAAELQEMRQLSGRLLGMRDEERRSVAHKLHENVAQYLAALKMYLSLARDSGGTPGVDMQNILAKGIEVLEKFYFDIRTMSYALHPMVLEEMGLAAAIGWYVEDFSRRSGIEVRLELQRDPGRLPLEFALAIFRIAEEALRNVQRHSGSTTGTVRIAGNRSQVELEVTDKGRGMPPAHTQASGDGNGGTGISQMRERVRQLGGRLEIASGASGTAVRAILPRPTGRPGRRASGLQSANP